MTASARATVETLCSTLAAIAPLRLAESWDNVGLLVGDRQRVVQRVMTCLTITSNVVDEALEQAADLVVSHHPLPFRPLERLTTDAVAPALLLRLIRGDIAVYSAHTAYDSAAEGINQAWANQLQLINTRPLVVPAVESPPTVTSAAGLAPPPVLGSGRYGELKEPTTLEKLLRVAANSVGAVSPRIVGDAQATVSRVAIACGSGGSFVAAAKHRGCQALLTGEATFHQCLEAEAWGVGLGLLGHYESERFGIERLAKTLAEAHPELEVWPSRTERSPIAVLGPSSSKSNSR